MSLDTGIAGSANESFKSFILSWFPFILLKFFGNSEINENIFTLCINHNVLRFYVLMNNMVIVESREGLQKFDCQNHDLVYGHGLFR